MKKRLIVILGVACLAACLAAWLVLSGWNAGGPVYHGKTLKEWSLQAYASPQQGQETAAALQALGPKAVPGLIRLLAQKDSTFHQKFWNWLQKRPPLMRRVLGRYVPIPNAPTVRQAAARSLGTIGPGAKAAVPALIRSFRDSGINIRWEAAYALGRIGPDAVPALTNALNDADPTVRHPAAYALGAVGSGATMAIPALITRLRDPDNSVRTMASSSLSGIGAPAMGPLMEVMLREHGPLAEAATNIVTAFYGLLRTSNSLPRRAPNDDPTARAHALEQLADGQTRQPAIARLLQGTIKDPAEEVRLVTIRILCHSEMKPIPLMLALTPSLKDESAAVREATARAIGELGPTVKYAARKLTPLLEDPEPSVRTAAKEAVAKIQPEKATD